MSKYNLGSEAKTLAQLTQLKGCQKISMVTCYDSAFARLVDQSDVDMVLVGDSLGNVIQGHDDTIPVTLEDIVYHSRAVSRVLKKPFLVSDMPFGTYANTSDAVKNAIRLVQDGRCQAVKLEGGTHIVDQVSAIVKTGIPVVGHLGLTPQSVHSLSGYRVQGRDAEAHKKMIEDAKALESAGASFLVLELVPKGLAKEISELLSIPTIGIGAGGYCDGQVLVLHDLLGFDQSFRPRFLKQYGNMGEMVVGALNEYASDVKEQVFPSDEHSFS